MTTTARERSGRTGRGRGPRRARPLATLIDDVLRLAAEDLSGEEVVHDLRVACRRVEAATRVNDGVLPPKALRGLRRSAREIRRAFDQARDLEVIAAELRAIPDLSPAFLAEMAVAGAAQSAGVAAKAAIDPALGRLRRVRARLTEADVPGREALAVTLDAHFAAFFHEIDRLLPESTDESLHEVRITAKKLRYEMEIARPLFARLTPLVKRMKQVQEILGRHQDASVGLRWAELLGEGEHGATEADRAALMRYYARLGLGQRRLLHRLLAQWQRAGMAGRFSAALTRRASASTPAADAGGPGATGG
jgi:CHAD domain-containing protein